MAPEGCSYRRGALASPCAPTVNGSTRASFGAHRKRRGMSRDWKSRDRGGRGMAKRILSDNRILTKHAAAIRRLGKRVIADVIEIGRLLTECKHICGHGNWLPWLDREFGWADDTALNFMRVYELSKSRKFRDLSLPLSGLYLLAAPSTPKEARDEIIERAQAGETVPVAEVKRTIERTKGRKQPSSKPDKPTTKPQANIADDFDADSRTEAERLRVRVEELQAQVRQRDIKITGLESEIEELRGKLATGTGGDMSISEFSTAIKKWEDTVETQKNIIRDLQNENAKLRAGVAAPCADDGLGIPKFLDRSKQTGAAS